MTEETQSNTISLKNAANTQQRSKSGIGVFSLISLLIIGALIIGGYFYLNREQEPTVLKIASGPYRSDSYELMREVADVVARNSDLIRVQVVPSRDSSENISFLNKGDVDLATIRADTPVVKNVRMVANLFPDYFQLISRGNSPIFRPKDLVGKKVAIAPYGTDEFRSFWILADHYDVPIREIKWKAMNLDTANDDLLAGKLDAIFLVRSLRDRLILNLFEDASLKQLPLRLVSINQAAAIAVKRPFLKVGNIAQGALLGKAPIPVQNATTVTVDRVLVTREGVGEEDIRELTRILFEHRLDLTIRFALANAIKRPSFEEGYNIPLHIGSEQYYTRDEPSFIQENAEPLALLVTVFALLLSGLIGLRTRFVSTQKNKMDSYNYVLLDIADKSRKVKTVGEIKELQLELYNMLEQVVRALDTDDVTEEGFQSFSLLWEAVREMLKDCIQDMVEEDSDVQAIAPTKAKDKSYKRKQKKAHKEPSI